MMEEEQLFLFQVTVDNIVITDKSCLSEKGGNDQIYVKIEYPDLNWIELDQVDFSSFQGKQSSKKNDFSDTTRSVVKLTSHQLFYSKKNIICNEGKSFLVSMDPTLLCSHFLENSLQVTLYQTMFLEEPSWIIGTNKFYIGEEMAQLIFESLKHPDLRDAPAAMDQQFPLHRDSSTVYGYLQCTICVSCAGKTSEFGTKNACYVSSLEEETEFTTKSESSQETINIEESVVSSESTGKMELKHRRKKMSRFLPVNNDVFSYYKGEEPASLDRNESCFIINTRKPEAAVTVPHNNNSIVHLPKSLPSRTDFTEITSGIFDEDSTCVDIDDMKYDDSTGDTDEDDDVISSSNPEAANTLEEFEQTPLQKSMRKSWHVPNFSYVPDISVPKNEAKRTKQKQFTSKAHDLSKNVSRSAKRISDEKCKIDFNTHIPSKSAMPTKLRKFPVDQKTPVTKKKVRGSAPDDKRVPLNTMHTEGHSLSIVKQNSVYHVAIKNSENRLNKIFKFKLYGDESCGKPEYRTPWNESLSITAIPTQREN